MWKNKQKLWRPDHSHPKWGEVRFGVDVVSDKATGHNVIVITEISDFVDDKLGTDDIQVTGQPGFMVLNQKTPIPKVDIL